MKPKCWWWLVGLLSLGLLGATLALPAPATAKVFLYALTLDGDLIKYDPDADQIVQVRPGVGGEHINPRNPDRDNFQPHRILDVARGRIVTFTDEDPGVEVLDLRTGTATGIAVASPQPAFQLKHLIYPRQASRFYVQWVRLPNPTDPAGPFLTAVGLDGRILATTPSMIDRTFGASIPHPDGRTFYVLNSPNELLRVDGETLAVQERYDLSPFYRAGAVRHGIADVRDGRALLTEGAGTGTGYLDPRIVSTVDLATRTASPRIATGLGASTLRLAPGGRTIVLQEARTAYDQGGAGRVHMYDVASGTKLGMVSFGADGGATLRGFHPDGRRLFIRTLNADPSTGDLESWLVVVDVVTRQVVVNRRFNAIGFAVDFVDEP